MKKSMVRKMIPGSSEYVIAHAAYQRSRGKQPSVAFCGIKNPKKALSMAIDVFLLKNEMLARSLMGFDAVDAAEKITEITGDYHAQNQLTLGLHMSKSRNLKAALRNIDDTTHSDNLSRYLRIVKEEGFQEILAIPFIGGSGYNETHYIFFHPTDGILLSFCTYGENSVNGGKFYYNWKPECDPKQRHYYTSSGSFVRDGDETIWVGDHDCREAFRMHLNDLRSHGKFVTPWVSSPFLWLLHYMDTKEDGYDFKQINQDRIVQFPDEVKQAIGF